MFEERSSGWSRAWSVQRVQWSQEWGLDEGATGAGAVQMKRESEEECLQARR